MSQTVIKGQKVDITKSNPGLSEIIVGLGWDAGSSMDIDASAFLVAPGGKVAKDEDFIFYGNPSGGNGTVELNSSNFVAGGSDKKQIRIDLAQVPSTIEKIAITITIYEAEARQQSFGQVTNIYLRLLDKASGTEILRFDLGANLTIENAIVAAEVYRYKGEWKLSATGAGFAGGLAALCKNFGIEVDDTPASPPQQTETPPPKQQTQSPPPPLKQQAQSPSPPSEPKVTQVNLTKIELKKQGEKINLTKTTGRLGQILINLNWNHKRTIGFIGRRKGVDLDLGCLYELKSGQRGVVQALGNRFGSLTHEPYIALDGDDRTGEITAGENLRINGDHIADIERILVFTFIYEGIVNWTEADGVVTITQTEGPDIVIRMNQYDTHKIMCALALIENVDNKTFSVERLVQFFSGHQDMDKAFNWGMRWVAGHK